MPNPARIKKRHYRVRNVEKGNLTENWYNGGEKRYRNYSADEKDEVHQYILSYHGYSIDKKRVVAKHVILHHIADLVLWMNVYLCWEFN